MSETPTQTETQTQPESQTQRETTQTQQVKVFYNIHADDFSSLHLRPLIILYNKRAYDAFIKERIGRPDMYYVLGSRIYIKLWNDIKRNVLVYVSSAYKNNMFFIRDIDIIKIEENIIYEYDMKRLKCPGKDVILKGFNIVRVIDELEPELLPPLFALICYRLT